MTDPVVKKDTTIVDLFCALCSPKEKVPHKVYYAMCVGNLWEKRKCERCGCPSQIPVRNKDEDKIINEFKIVNMDSH